MMAWKYRSASCGFWLVCLLTAWGSLGQAQEEASGEQQTVLHAYKLENQPATEAVSLVYPLLSSQGTVELKPQENTLVIRDNLAAISRISPVLSRFDHPRRLIELEIQIVRATADKFSPPPKSQLSKELQERLQDLLPYHSYALMAETRLRSREGEQVSYRLGQRFDIQFRLGTLLERRRIRLHDFQVQRIRTDGDGVESQKSLIHTNLFLFLDQTFSLGLASSEASREALMVVLTARVAEPQSVGGFGVPTPDLAPDS